MRRWAASLRLVTLLALAALLGFGPLGPNALAREAHRRAVGENP